MKPPFAIDLTSRTVLLFRGADRVRFLNGQISNDVRKLSSGQAMPACVMTARGKMNAEIWVSVRGEVLRVDGPPGMGEQLLARFERYIIADDVTVEDATGAVPFFHMVGGTGDGVVAARYRLPGLDVEMVPGNIPVLTPEQVESLRIGQGVPAWGLELTEDTLPAEAGLDQVAVDFHKGCYIGQEVVSRIKSVGHVNRRLVRLTAPSGTVLPPGLPLWAGEQEAGVITSSAPSLDLEKTVALAYLRRSFFDTPPTRPAGITVHPLFP